MNFDASFVCFLSCCTLCCALRQIWMLNWYWRSQIEMSSFYKMCQHNNTITKELALIFGLNFKITILIKFLLFALKLNFILFCFLSAILFKRENNLMPITCFKNEQPKEKISTLFKRQQLRAILKGNSKISKKRKLSYHQISFKIWRRITRTKGWLSFYKSQA